MKTPIPLPTPTENQMKRLWSRVDIAANGCHLWTGPVTRHGYVSFRVGNHTYQAHRLVYFWTTGSDPSALVVDHLCHNGTDCHGGVTCWHRRCMNPAHLQAITEAENILLGRAPSAQHARATHCQLGHPYNTTNTVVLKDGRRNCKTCKNRQARERYRLRASR